MNQQLLLLRIDKRYDSILNGHFSHCVIKIDSAKILIRNIQLLILQHSDELIRDHSAAEIRKKANGFYVYVYFSVSLPGHNCLWELSLSKSLCVYGYELTKHTEERVGIRHRSDLGMRNSFIGHKFRRGQSLIISAPQVDEGPLIAYWVAIVRGGEDSYALAIMAYFIAFFLDLMASNNVIQLIEI